MAEISNLHRFNHSNSDEHFFHSDEPYFQHLDSFSYPFNPSNASFLDDYTTSFGLGFELDENMGTEYEDPNCFFDGVEEDEEQTNYVTDLFESARMADDPIWEIDLGPVEDTDDEFGFGPGLGGLRLAGIDSDEFEVNSSFVNNGGVPEDDVFETIAGYNCRNSENSRYDFEWEEVGDRVAHDEREDFDSVIERIEELSVSSHVSPSEVGNSRLDDDFFENSRFLDQDDEFEDEEQNVSWEVLLASDNSERNFDLDVDLSSARVIHPEDYVLTTEYDTLFDQIVENDTARKGTPPASKFAVENLPTKVLTKEELDNNNGAVTCAVCKDEVPIGEKVTKMPCCHLYHKDCIIPWLGIRNTCPICRYELPTDDADYEKRKRDRANGCRTARVTDNDVGVRYNFEFLP